MILFLFGCSRPFLLMAGKAELEVRYRYVGTIPNLAKRTTSSTVFLTIARVGDACKFPIAKQLSIFLLKCSLLLSPLQFAHIGPRAETLPHLTAPRRRYCMICRPIHTHYSSQSTPLPPPVCSLPIYIPLKGLLPLLQWLGVVWWYYVNFCGQIVHFLHPYEGRFGTIQHPMA